MFNNVLTDYGFSIDLLHYLSMALLQSLTFISAMIYRQRYTESRTAKRYLYGTGSLLGIWITLIAFLILSNSFSNMAILLPVLEQLANSASLILLVWVFITADQVEGESAIGLMMAVGLVVVILAFIATGLRWVQLASLVDFSSSALSLIWIILNLVLSCGGLFIIYRARKELLSLQWKLGAIGIFAILQLLRLGSYLFSSPVGMVDIYGRVGLWAMIFAVPITFYIKIIYGYERALKEIRTQMQVIPQNRSLSIATPRSVRYTQDTESFDVHSALLV